MQPLTSAQLKKLEKLAKVGDIGIADELNALEGKIEALQANIDGVRNDIPDVQGIVDAVKIKKGEKGDDYILTEDDKRAIASSITVPVVEKVIERTEVIKEIPIVTNKVTNQIVKETIEKQIEVAVLDEATVAYLEDEIKKTKLDKEAYDRALGIVDQRTSFLINKISGLVARIEVLEASGGGGTGGPYLKIG